MISRRRFIQATFALAALPAIGVVTFEQMPAAPKLWIPTEAQVGEWLEWYKASVQTAFIGHVRDFFPGDVVLPPEPDFVPLYDNRFFHARVEPVEMTTCTIEQFDKALAKLEAGRMEVGMHQGGGYEAGRRGDVRECAAYERPSACGFAWHNGWMTGNLDYRFARGEYKPPRSPGVTWPNGKPKPRWTVDNVNSPATYKYPRGDAPAPTDTGDCDVNPLYKPNA